MPDIHSQTEAGTVPEGGLDRHQAENLIQQRDDALRRLEEAEKRNAEYVSLIERMNARG
jgi:hypothetical protein